MLLGAILVVMAMGSSEGREHRIIPIHAMSENVEVLYGDPEAEGES